MNRSVERKSTEANWRSFLIATGFSEDRRQSWNAGTDMIRLNDTYCTCSYDYIFIRVSWCRCVPYIDDFFSQGHEITPWKVATILLYTLQFNTLKFQVDG